MNPEVAFFQQRRALIRQFLMLPLAAEALKREELLLPQKLLTARVQTLTPEEMMLYTSSLKDEDAIPNPMLWNMTGDPYILPFHYGLDFGAIFQARVVPDTEFVELIPAIMGNLGFPWGNRFVKRKHLSLNSDHEPITVNPEIKPHEKQIIVAEQGIFHDRPELYLLEKTGLVMAIPVVLGKDSVTPKGDFRIERMILQNMIGNRAGLWAAYIGSGIAFHTTYLWQKSMYTDGLYPHSKYGSGGCINLPIFPEWRARVNDRLVYLDEFLIRWLATNMPQTGPFSYHARYNDPDYKKGISSVRALIVPTIDDLLRYPEQPGVPWEEVIADIRSYQGKLDKNNWLFPTVNTRRKAGPLENFLNRRAHIHSTIR